MRQRILAFVVVVGAILFLIGSADASLAPLEVCDRNNLTTFIAAVHRAGFHTILGPQFKGTVFVPSNQAWTKFAVDNNLKEADLLNSRPLLQHLLSYHIINHSVYTRHGLKTLQTLPTYLPGAHLTVYRSRYGPVRILFGELLLRGNGFDYDGFASIIKPNLKTEHAVLHAINRVLTPPARGGEV